MRRLPPSLVLYRLASGLAEPLAPMLLRRRAARGKEDPAKLGERLGHAGRARPAGPLAWLHGASVGEALSLLALIDDLRAARPDLNILVTAGTRTAADLLAKRLPANALHQYLPVDGPAAARRFIDHWRPDLGVFVESEIWPNLLLEAERRGVRMALLSAKLSDTSLNGWTRFGAAARRLFGVFELLMAQDARAAGRLESLGVTVAGIADMKFGADPLPVDEVALAEARAAIGARAVILAASTHPGEDEAVLNAFASQPDGPLLVIVPRHPERGPAVAALAKRQDLTVSLQSRGDPIGAERVRVADAMGELGLWFRVASLALVGGSLVDGVGGHNPLEPARLGCPAISGPYVENWQGAYGELLLADATALVPAEGLPDWFAAGADKAAKLWTMAERATIAVTARDSEARAVSARLLALMP